jgi:uncharacterized membrane protein
VNKHRIEAFSDGVFAVAITILALNLTVPKDPASLSHGLWHDVESHWPPYAAYVVSFMIIGIIWISHNSVFRHIAELDRTLVFLNLLLLMFVVVIPFPTVLVAEFLNKGEPAHVALALYSAVMLAQAIVWSVIWWWVASHPHLLDAKVDPELARKAVLRFSAGTPIYVLAIVISFINADVALLFHFLVAIAYSFEQLKVERPVLAAPAAPPAEGSDETPTSWTL